MAKLNKQIGYICDSCGNEIEVGPGLDNSENSEKLPLPDDWTKFEYGKTIKHFCCMKCYYDFIIKNAHIYPKTAKVEISFGTLTKMGQYVIGLQNERNLNEEILL